MPATPAEMLKDAVVTNYQVLSTYGGRPVRRATKVTLFDGRCIRFLDRLSRREALRQAEHYLRREQA
jgi:hypothetical protein